MKNVSRKLRLRDSKKLWFWIGVGVIVVAIGVVIVAVIAARQLTMKDEGCCSCPDCPSCDVCCDCGLSR